MSDDHPKSPYEVCDPAKPDEWVRFHEPYNPIAAVKAFLVSTGQRPRYGDPPRVFLVRHPSTPGDVTRVLVRVPPPRFEVKGATPWRDKVPATAREAVLSLIEWATGVWACRDDVPLATFTATQRERLAARIGEVLGVDAEAARSQPITVGALVAMVEQARGTR